MIFRKPSTIDTSVEGTQDYIFTPSEEGNTYRITISVISVSETPTGEIEQTFTSGQTLADLVVNGENLVWYSNQALTETLPETTKLVDKTTYYVVSENETCKSQALAILVTEEVANLSDYNLYGFTFYPNPVNDILRFSSNQPIENVTFSNMLEQQVKVNLSLNVSNLAYGNYLVKITIEGVSKTFKIVKK